MADGDPIVQVLEDLLREDDILATMVVRKGFEGASPSPEKFKLKDPAVWNNLQETMADMFDIISQFVDMGLDKVYLEVGNYEILLFLIRGDIVLMTVMSAQANRGLLEIEVENARRAIRDLVGGAS